MLERIESLKVGIIGAFSLFIAFIIASLFNTLVISKYFPVLASLAIEPLELDFALSGAIASFSGFLFGATYRYIIRKDSNPHLKSGGVLAFGLVRGLAQIEASWNSLATVLPSVVLAGESVLWFAIAARVIDTAMQIGWLKPFPSIPTDY
ncbi:hypothetical protein H6G33_33550 [Calothrix sp. FACHB-1219]|uniref:hypothetical protein n=1 Tax=unclassified Calothrix TaxID=2619626 RepID=UPI001685E5F6|nr:MULTISPECIES: hypothetical protein [unclassified Calothrix]MBD2204358.1 hypothetical protein [Calothrix sp. FACHB-168]MBD2221881.1 hypothetical protein [Calothrix sp. FACHB-1219]